MMPLSHHAPTIIHIHAHRVVTRDNTYLHGLATCPYTTNYWPYLGYTLRWRCIWEFKHQGWSPRCVNSLIPWEAIRSKAFSVVYLAYTTKIKGKRSSNSTYWLSWYTPREYIPYILPRENIWDILYQLNQCRGVTRNWKVRRRARKRDQNLQYIINIHWYSS